MPGREPSTARFAGIGLWLQAPGADGVAPTDRVLERAAGAAAAADRAGIGTVWVTESPRPPGVGTPYEAYSMLGALGVRSDRVHLGVVADGAERRPPSILAKIVTGVDVISHGRAVLALDGDCTSEQDAERLSEALIVCRAVLVDDHPTYAGRIYSIDNAVNRPAPVQPGGVPITVFLHGDGPGREPLLDVAARLADAVVVAGGADAVADVTRSVATHRDAGDRPSGAVEVLGRIGSGAGPAGLADAVAAVRSAGASGCLVGLDYPWDPDAVEDLGSLW